MIGKGDVIERVKEWGLREGAVEKDYVIGWVLWGTGSAHWNQPRQPRQQRRRHPFPGLGRHARPLSVVPLEWGLSESGFTGFED